MKLCIFLIAALLALTGCAAEQSAQALPTAATELSVETVAATEETLPEETVPEETIPEETLPEYLLPLDTLLEAERITCDSRGNMLSRFVRRYDERGNEIMRVSFSYPNPKKTLHYDMIPFAAQYQLDQIIGEDEHWHEIRALGCVWNADGTLASVHRNSHIGYNDKLSSSWSHCDYVWAENGVMDTENRTDSYGSEMVQEVVFPYYDDNINTASAAEYPPALPQEVLVDTPEQWVAKTHYPTLGKNKFHVIHYNDDETTAEVCVYMSDSALDTYQEQDLTSRTVYEYPEDGSTVYTSYNANGGVTGKTVVQYDSNGEKLNSTQYDAGGKVESVTEYASGISTSYTRYGTNGKIESVTEYDEYGNMAVSTQYQNNSVVSVSTFTYQPLSELLLTDLEGVCIHEVVAQE